MSSRKNFVARRQKFGHALVASERNRSIQLAPIWTPRLKAGLSAWPTDKRLQSSALSPGPRKVDSLGIEHLACIANVFPNVFNNVFKTSVRAKRLTLIE